MAWYCINVNEEYFSVLYNVMMIFTFFMRYIKSFFYPNFPAFSNPRKISQFIIVANFIRPLIIRKSQVESSIPQNN